MSKCHKCYRFYGMQFPLIEASPPALSKMVFASWPCVLQLPWVPQAKAGCWGWAQMLSWIIKGNFCSPCLTNSFPGWSACPFSAEFHIRKWANKLKWGEDMPAIRRGIKASCPEINWHFLSIEADCVWRAAHNKPISLPWPKLIVAIMMKGFLMPF